MKQALSIMIIDADRYFTYGLGLGLQAFFQARQQEIRLLEETQSDSDIDILFLGDLVTSYPWHYRLHQRKNYPLVFFITEQGRNKNQLKPRVNCERCNTRALYRHQSLATLYQRLDSVLFSSGESPAAPNHGCSCMYPLTSREEEVLRCIHRGMNGQDTGNYLHISNKTANAHKQNAMRKLNFRCNQELYQWLLQGGGHYLNERSSANQPDLPQQPKVPAESSLISAVQLVGRPRSYAALSAHKQPDLLGQRESIST
ncbi:MAG: LuxR C-terminal-related transcriptional regulator [Enterobacterales bacterium]|uniref:helix-turn-helix transcriptional regulator n=1 Tax=Serratia sp. (in: enterobacteria) TaxID=616 RepID=UPI003F387319